MLKEVVRLRGRQRVPKAELRLRLSAEDSAVIEELARAAGRSPAVVASELLREASRMRRVPGIYFRGKGDERIACVAETGLAAWEIVEAWRRLEESWERLQQAFHWLTDAQLRAALDYAAVYPSEIEAALAENAAWTPERIRAAAPAARQPKP